jgi:hypothetical protein
MLSVRRLALALLVGLLTANFSGALEVLVPEPCTVDEASSTADGRCPPTCARCGCCAQPVVSTPLVVASTQLVTRDETPVIDDDLASPEPVDVFHVPRSLAA